MICRSDKWVVGGGLKGVKRGEEARKRALSHPFRREMTFRPEKGGENWRERELSG